MLIKKYHLPHNSIRVDEFNFMLNALDKTKDYYLYNELRIHFLCEEIKAGYFSIFHRKPDENLKNHVDPEIRNIYNRLLSSPTPENANALFNVKYTPKKTFKQVWNEFVRDYTEFFAFLGLLPTYYKGSGGDSDKKHYITKRLKDYCNDKLSLREVILNLKYRNTSKDNDSFEMYDIKVRPFVIAIKALKYFSDLGHCCIDPHVLSAIVIYSENEQCVEKLCAEFKNPALNIKDYNYLFYVPENAASGYVERSIKEIERATLLLKPYLEELKLIEVVRYGQANKYKPLVKNFDLQSIPEKCAFCNGFVGNLKLTPLIGKALYVLYSKSKTGETTRLKTNEIFDEHFNEQDIKTILGELANAGILAYNGDTVTLFERKKQYAINPYTEFFTIDDANYVADLTDLRLEEDSQIITAEATDIDGTLEQMRSIAYGSDGPLYEKTLFGIINENFGVFKNKKWYGASATGKRISDIAFTADIFDNDKPKRILIVIECKAGGAIKAFDERKEINDVENLLKIFPEKRIDGVWYWVVNGDSLPGYDEHGGYRANEYSKNLLQKLNDIQFAVSEYSRTPTIVTAFSYNAVCEYLRYLYMKTRNVQTITPFIVPHFWRWSKKFMNLQYVTIHKQLNVGESNGK